MHLICSKSRILPKKTNKGKPITTPRAELLAALLLSRLTEKTIATTDIGFESVNLWTDSQIVLCRIGKPAGMLQQYVSNRVGEIQRITNSFKWRYIPTQENPADIISRGILPRKILQNPMWWGGPPMLKKAMIENVQPEPIDDENLPEMRAVISLVATIPVKQLTVFERANDYDKTIKAMAYFVRFAKFIISKRQTVLKGPLTILELRTALVVTVRCVQKEVFQPELRAIAEGGQSKHRLCGLKPFIDPRDGLLRVGGRIKKPTSDVAASWTPVHGSTSTEFAPDEPAHWTERANPQKTSQLMGDLPSYRIQPAPTFAYTGVDFAGPFMVKSLTTAKKPLVTKALFICMLTRAIHVELVNDLSTVAFLAALRRFSSRRGLPKKILSDNATNFVGAQNELEELGRLFEDQQQTKKITEYCRNEGIEWSFIPPRSPHFGGIWEAGVKQVKHHLTRIVGGRQLSYEELYTVLTQIEAVLNSRPLVPCSDDPSDLTAITPAHFLIGREMKAVAEPSYLHLKQSTLSRWQHVQAMFQQFWRRWTAEYLPELQNRSKWTKKIDVPVGAMVLMIDRDASPFQWPLGRVLAVHPGKDGVTRVVTVKTSKGEYKRAITEIRTSQSIVEAYWLNSPRKGHNGAFVGVCAQSIVLDEPLKIVQILLKQMTVSDVFHCLENLYIIRVNKHYCVGQE
ncbi:uncharacterized protein LOC129761138 [Toxorhynchites rutilus septentrionalis]|uniref:uncharacterized protein LOC129761138 n=1 Tax=Toxorhynchites rutilus septentrionalis TaxID=329112 RepID=UPI0024797765|nr:uncharacterized protein LOC129761138 [Toxorhynchites rutilus septentrionalis]